MMRNARLFLVLVALVWGLAASAQNWNKGPFVELSVSDGAGDTGYTLIAPAVGYRFANRWSAGFRMQFDTGIDYNVFGLFGQYRFVDLRRFAVFAEGQVSYIRNPDEMLDGSTRTMYDNYAEAGVTFGASYRLWRGLRLTARYLYLGYSGSSSFRRSDGCWGDGSFVLDAGWNRLQVGLQYTF